MLNVHSKDGRLEHNAMLKTHHFRIVRLIVVREAIGIEQRLVEVWHIELKFGLIDQVDERSRATQQLHSYFSDSYVTQASMHIVFMRDENVLCARFDRVSSFARNIVTNEIQELFEKKEKVLKTTQKPQLPRR